MISRPVHRGCTLLHFELWQGCRVPRVSKIGSVGFRNVTYRIARGCTGLVAENPSTHVSSGPDSGVITLRQKPHRAWFAIKTWPPRGAFRSNARRPRAHPLCLRSPGSAVALHVGLSSATPPLCSGKPSSEFSRALYTFIWLDEKGESSLNLQQHESARLVNFLGAV